jgi:hypothetical protein
MKTPSDKPAYSRQHHEIYTQARHIHTIRTKHNILPNFIFIADVKRAKSAQFSQLDQKLTQHSVPYLNR